MPDFTMCVDDECPFRAKCRRHPDSGTKPSAVQSYALFAKRGKAIVPRNCEGYWSTVEREAKHQ